MKKVLIASVSAFIAAAASAAQGVPVVSNVSFVQNPDRQVLIAYTTDEPAVITIDVLTNNATASIGQENIRNLSGDVNKIVPAGQHAIVWHPDLSWPAHKANGAVIRVNAWATDAPPPYMVVNLAEAGDVRFYPTVDAVPEGVGSDIYKTTSLLMRRIPATDQTWTMGSVAGEKGRDDATEVAQTVTLHSDFYIGVYEVTQKQWNMMMGNWPAYFAVDSTCRDMRPVENVEFSSIRSTEYPTTPSTTSFLGKLRTQSGDTVTFDLPGEAQWEFACRAGRYGAYWNNGEAITGDDWDVAMQYRLGRYCWNGGKVDGKTLPPQSSSTNLAHTVVGSFSPNGFGLYDMHGNVSEYCLDRWGDNPTTDGSVRTSGSDHVNRGGSYYYGAGKCRSAARDHIKGVTVGFRVTASTSVGK